MPSKWTIKRVWTETSQSGLGILAEMLGLPVALLLLHFLIALLLWEML